MTPTARTWQPGPPLDRMASLVAAADADDARCGPDRDRRHQRPAENLCGSRQHHSPAQAAANCDAKRRAEELARLGVYVKTGRPCRPIMSDRGERFRNARVAAREMGISDATIYNALKRGIRAKGRLWTYADARIDVRIDATPEQIIAALRQPSADAAGAVGKDAA
jgi:hypothetical protein